ncbi:MAG: hypothetical protein DME22_06500 [Verrucomicrobia bacterium]|nr:MAG: hypothetical protein DME22_06500 [Verrucomicrobiota bacterium]
MNQRRELLPGVSKTQPQMDTDEHRFRTRRGCPKTDRGSATRSNLAWWKEKKILRTTRRRTQQSSDS